MKQTLSRLFGAVLLCVGSLSAAAEIDVMTQNQYLGADLAPVLGAATAEDFDAGVFSAAVVQALGKIAAARPAERVRALASMIAQRNPDVVGLQEAYMFDCLPYPGYPAQRGVGCDDATIRGAFSDQLLSTVAALKGKYVLAGRVTNLQVPSLGPEPPLLPGLPFLVNGYPALLVAADRDAILVRKGLPAHWVDFAAAGVCPKPSDQGCNFQVAPPPLETEVGKITIERGFLAVDVMVKGRAYRVFNTHLEQRLLAPNLPDTRLLQVGQAYELLGTVFYTWDGSKKVIVVGDINSAPVDTIPIPPYPETLPWASALPVMPPYQVFTFNGFTDAWTLRPHARDEGLTCCQAENLLNLRSELYERIDMIFSLTPPSRVLDMKLLGNTMGDKTRPSRLGGLWPSDHAAVAARLKFD
ncbi:MAG: hypothetical protein IH627_02320 [Rubrivivax sp.]|nr:hypothetical protein [Rubrivivax sp.]